MYTCIYIYIYTYVPLKRECEALHDSLAALRSIIQHTEENTFKEKKTSTYKGLQHMFAALFSY